MKFDASLLVVVAIFGVAYFLLKVFLFDRLLRTCRRASGASRMRARLAAVDRRGRVGRSPPSASG